MDNAPVDYNPTSLLPGISTSKRIKFTNKHIFLVNKMDFFSFFYCSLGISIMYMNFKKKFSYLFLSLIFANHEPPTSILIDIACIAYKT